MTASDNSVSTTWSEQLIPVAIKYFTSHVGPTIFISDTPLDIFELFFSQSLQEIKTAACLLAAEVKYLTVCNGRGRQSGFRLLNRLADHAFIDISPDKASMAGLIAEFLRKTCKLNYHP